MNKLSTIEPGAQVNHTLVCDGVNGDLDVSDENGNVILHLKGGHLYVQKFRSDNTLSTENLQIRTELSDDETGNRELHLFLIGYNSEGKPQEYGPYSLPYATEISEGTMSAQDKRDIRDMKGQLTAILAGAKVTVGLNPTVIHVGVLSDVLVSAKITGVVAESLELYEGSVISDNLIASGTNKTSVSSSKKYIETSDISFVAVAKFSGATMQASGSLLVRHPIYCGFATEPTAITDDAHKLSPRTSAAGTYSATAQSDGVRYFILVPIGVSVPTNFTMGGAPYVMERGTFSISRVSYTVFMSGAVYNTGANVNIIAS